MSNSVYSDLDLFIGQKPKIYSPHPVYDHYGEIIDKQEAKKRLNLDQSVNYLLFFGFIRDYKGLDLLLEALTNKELLSHNVKLLVAGEFYSNEKKYYDLIKTLGVKKHVELRTGYIPENEVNLYFCACDIVSQPYKSATQSGVTQIGYHFEKPMLVTNVGGLPEIIAHDKCGYVVEVNSGAISSALIDFYTKQREAEMIKEVKKAKKKFGWDALSKSIFTLSDLCN
jgi:glycosyltransferase involved in cell wall biosynthesis